MKNFKVGDKVKSRESGNFGIVIDTDITPNKLFVKVKFSIGGNYEIDVPKRFLDYVSEEEWKFVESMENRKD